MKKIKFVAALLIIISATLNSGQTAHAQNISVQIFQLKKSAAERAQGLEKFYQPNRVAKRYDATNRIAFKMKCRQDSTFMIYFPNNDKSTGEECGDCADLYLYKRQGNWFSDNAPKDGKEYSADENDWQLHEIEMAVLFLSQKK